MDIALSQKDLIIGKGIVFSDAMHQLFSHAPLDVIETLAQDIQSATPQARKNRVSIFAATEEGDIRILAESSKNKASAHATLARQIFDNKDEAHLVDVITRFDENGDFQSAQKYFYYPANDLVVVVEAEKNIQEMAQLCAFSATTARQERAHLKEVMEHVDRLGGEKEEALKNAAHDSLTGLLNRSTLEDSYNAAYGEALRHDTYLGVVVFDLDFFKVVNDTYGHPAGDMVLSQFANRLKRNSRSSDSLHRFGGEEFVAIVNADSEEGAIQYAEIIRKKIAEKAFPITYKEDGKIDRAMDLPVTVSIGVSSIKPEKGESISFEDLFKTADAALYIAKGKNDPSGAGRNRVWHLPHETSATPRSEKKVKPLLSLVV